MLSLDVCKKRAPPERRSRRPGLVAVFPGALGKICTKTELPDVELVVFAFCMNVYVTATPAEAPTSCRTIKPMPPELLKSCAPETPGRAMPTVSTAPTPPLPPPPPPPAGCDNPTPRPTASAMMSATRSTPNTQNKRRRRSMLSSTPGWRRLLNDAVTVPARRRVFGDESMRRKGFFSAATPASSNASGTTCAGGAFATLRLTVAVAIVRAVVAVSAALRRSSSTPTADWG